MDYGQPVRFGVFLTPDALRWFATDVMPAVRDAVAGAR
jgi:hypothetical protein